MKSYDGFSANGAYTIGYTEVTLDGNVYFLPDYAKHRDAVSNVLQGILYEPHTHLLVKAFCQRFTGSMIHAGAFFGDMLPAFSAAVQGDVLAFEPVLENYVLARLCVDRNELHNVTLFNCALGDSISNLRMDTKQSATLHAGGGSRISDRGQITPSMTIDALGRRDIILIHLDVEGYEAMALAGARKTLRHCRPLLAIEDDDNVHTDHIRKMGYEPSGRIPGLNLFAPAENMAFRSALSEILNTILR